MGRPLFARAPIGGASAGSERPRAQGPCSLFCFPGPSAVHTRKLPKLPCLSCHTPLCPLWARLPTNGPLSGSIRRGACTGVVPQTVSANSEATAPRWEPKNVSDMCVRPCFCLCRVCNLSSSSLLLHRLHESSPKGALTPCHTSPPPNQIPAIPPPPPNQIPAIPPPPPNQIPAIPPPPQSDTCHTSPPQSDTCHTPPPPSDTEALCPPPPPRKPLPTGRTIIRVTALRPAALV